MAQLSTWPQGPCCAPDYVLGARDSEKLGNIPYLELPAQWERRHLNRALKDVARTLNELGMHWRIWALNQPGRRAKDGFLEEVTVLNDEWELPREKEGGFQAER